MANFFVTLSPLEPYFFGSELKLAGGVTNVRTSYFLRSKLMPSQTTLMGMIRFFLLKQSDGLYADYRIDENLIGKESFSLSKLILNSEYKNFLQGNGVQDFGVIKNVGPVFLTDQKENYYIVTPKNHRVGKLVYTPYEMIKVPADGKSNSFLLKDYNGKKGVACSYTRLSDGKIFEIEELFEKNTAVGIDKKSDEESFFKKEYKYLKPKMKFAFFLSLDETSEIFQKKLNCLLEKDVVMDIVYMGLGKSVFSIEIKRKDDDFFKQIRNLSMLNSSSKLITYYTVSDTLFLKNPNLPFAIIETDSFRHLATQKNSKNYWGRMISSNLYQVVKPGSMFFIREDSKSIFREIYDIKNCKKIGMNQLIGSDN